jgi:hypothetical protein
MKQAAVAAIVLMLASHAAAQAACVASRGERVVLKSNTVDPDVFVWDRKALMISYASGVWPGTRDVLQHTLLTSPGTTAIVAACEVAAIRPSLFPSVQDAVAIRLMSGPYRGRYGWVASNDIHPLRPARR